MLHFDGKYARCEHIASIHAKSNCKFWYHFVFAHLPTSFGEVIFDNKNSVALHHSWFRLQCCGSLAKLILKGLWVPNVHHYNNISFWQCDFVRECRIWEIIKDIDLGQKLFGPMWQLQKQLHGWKFARILPTAPVKMDRKSRINETKYLMKFSFWSVILRSLDLSRSACILLRGDM